MAMAAARAEGQSYSDINMTPLIDVMLVLLIIFIITIPTQTHAVKIDNQTPNPNPPTSKPEVIDLSIDFDGALRWNNQLIDRAALRSYTSQNAARVPQPEVHITVDRSTKYQLVAQTLADLQSRGLRMIGLVNNARE
jgi:biopolymer transport protein ExbD